MPLHAPARGVSGSVRLQRSTDKPEPTIRETTRAGRERESTTNGGPQRTEFRFLLATLVIFGLLAFYVFRPYLYYIALAVLLVFAFFPAHLKIQKRVKSPSLAAFLSFLIVAAVIVGPIIVVGFLVFQDAVAFAKSYDPDGLNETLQPMLSRFGVGEEKVEGENGTYSRPSQAANFLGAKVRDIAEAMGKGLLQALPNLLLGLFVVGFIIYYGFLEGERFYRQVRHVVPLPEHIEESLFGQIRDVTKAVFMGTLFTSLLTSVLGTITFLIFGVPNAVFWGFIMVIFGILPILGPPFIYVPVSAWLVLDGHPLKALGVFSINLVVGTIYIERILGPKFIGKLGRIHPVWVLIGVLGGLEVFGMMGFVLGPLVLAVFIALVRSYTEFHPRWVERVRRGEEPFYPGGQVAPQPFEKAPTDAPASPPTAGAADPKR